MFVQRLKRLRFKGLAGVVAWGGAFAALCAPVLSTRVSAAETSSATQIAGSQTSDEMLREGFEALSDHQSDEARQFFQKIIKIYPHSRASAAAEQELARMQEGGEGETSADLISDVPDADPQVRNKALLERTEEQAKRLRRTFVTEVGDRVFFAENSASIGGRARAILESQAHWLKARPELTVKLIGRADDGGNAASAQALAVKRGEAVRDKLLEFGLPPDRIVLEPRADQDPIATCRTSLCQAQNRHVETLIGSPRSNMLGDNERRPGDSRKDAAAAPIGDGRRVAR